MKISEEVHRKLHEDLHKNFDQLVADFIFHTGKFLSKTTLIELMVWSYEQTQFPTPSKYSINSKNESMKKYTS